MVSFIRNSTVIRILVFGVVVDWGLRDGVCTQYGAPPGHLLPIGKQRPVLHGHIEEVDMLISGSAFYREYFLPAKPVVFRGVLKHTRAMKTWVNDTYMREHYGSVRGIVDRRTRWERGGIETPPRSMMSFSEFLDVLPNEAAYWDDMIPYDNPILKDMPIPLPINCEVTRTVFRYINLMVNSGDVSYVLHLDHADNFFHFLSGEKTWLIANSSFSDSAYIGQGTQTPFLSPVNPDAVDLIKYPRIAEIDFHKLVLKPGDLLYVPRDWVHYVRSTGTPNIAMNIWFGGEDIMDYRRPQYPFCRFQLKTAKHLFRKTVNLNNGTGQ